MRTTILITGVVALVALGVAAPVSGGASGDRCAARGVTVAQTDAARLYRKAGTGKRLWACALGKRQEYAIVVGGCLPVDCAVAHVTLAGRFVAYVETIRGRAGTTARTVTVRDLRTGRIRAGSASAGDAFDRSGDGVTALVLDEAGRVAWIFRDTSQTPTVFEVHAGTTVADVGPGIDLDSLATSGSIVYWRRDGTAQSSEPGRLTLSPRR